MKNAIVNVIPVRPIRVQFNGAKATRDKWARIIDAQTGQVLHTGQPGYIKQLAKKRYRHKVN